MVVWLAYDLIWWIGLIAVLITWLIECLIDWLIWVFELLMGCLIGWLVDWFTNTINGLIGWLVVWHVDLLACFEWLDCFIYSLFGFVNLLVCVMRGWLVFVGWLCGCLIAFDWLFRWFAKCIDSLVGWLGDRLIACVDWLVASLIGWFVRCVVGWLIHRLVRLIAWLIGLVWLSRWLIHCLISSLICLIDQLVHVLFWLIWLIGWFDWLADLIVLGHRIDCIALIDLLCLFDWLLE